MRNITVTVDDDTYKRARIAAAGRDTSVSALVKAYLVQLGSHETEIERLKRQEREIRSSIVPTNSHAKNYTADRCKIPYFFDTNMLFYPISRGNGRI